MSNIYIQEPPTSGKVLLKTSIGDLELELWTKEAPKACRNFIQLCMEGYYNGTIFHRVVKGFICQGGDPTGTGQGGESIYGQPFKDEIHTRLRFCRRGLLAMANAGKDDNSSQFFFTFSATPELQNKHTIFGKVTGETIYNMLKLEDAIVDTNERPTYPQKIIKAEILLNPFTDIVPRCDPSIQNKLDDDDDDKKKKKKKKVGVKNFKLLSFGEEAEEDEEESVELSKKYIGKGKSAHDSLSDPKLSSVLAIEVSGDSSCKKRKRDEDKHLNDDNEEEEEEEDEECVKKASKEIKERIISKLQDKKKHSKSDLKISKSNLVVKNGDDDDDDDDDDEEEEEYYFGKDRDDENKKKVEAIQKQIREFKKELKNEKFAKEEVERKKIQDIEKSNKQSDVKNKYIKAKEEFIEAKLKIPKKGLSREKATQELLMKFRNKLKNVKQQKEELDNVDDDDNNEDKNNKNDDDGSWITTVFNCEEKKQPVLAKDANTKDDDWFEIYDPRNPINKRRRADNNKSSKKSNSSTRSSTRY